MLDLSSNLTGPNSKNLSIDEKSLSKEAKLLNPEIEKLKALGIKEVHLEGVDPRIAFEMTRQLVILCKAYPEIVKNSVSWFGTTQSLMEQSSKNLFEVSYACHLALGASKEKAIEFAQEFSKPSEVVETSIATFHAFVPFINLEQTVNDIKSAVPADIDIQKLLRKNVSIIKAISVNKNYAKSYWDLKLRLHEDVDINFHAEGTDNPSAIITHECNHVLLEYILKRAAKKGALRDKILNEFSKIEQLFQSNTDYIIDNVGIYATKNTKEFVACAFAQSYCSETPSEVALVVRRFVDNCIEAIREENLNV